MSHLSRFVGDVLKQLFVLLDLSAVLFKSMVTIEEILNINLSLLGDEKVVLIIYLPNSSDIQFSGSLEQQIDEQIQYTNDVAEHNNQEYKRILNCTLACCLGPSLSFSISR